jgi:hypothetical protein
MSSRSFEPGDLVTGLFQLHDHLVDRLARSELGGEFRRRRKSVLTVGVSDAQTRELAVTPSIGMS